MAKKFLLLQLFFCFLLLQNFSSIKTLAQSRSRRVPSTSNEPTKNSTKSDISEVVSVDSISLLTSKEILDRVNRAYATNQGMDDIALDIDRKGIDFVVENAFANKIRFFRGAVVVNALWRADDRRKLLSAKPKHPNLQESQTDAKQDLKTLPFLEQARAIALAYVDSLPNFVVREQVQRYEKVSKENWKRGDYLEIEASYNSGQGEQLKLKQQNGSTTNLTLDKVGGLTSTGQFAGQLASLFNPDSKTEFILQGDSNFYGQPCTVYSYRVLEKNSQQRIKIEKSEIISGYRGKIFISRDSKQVLRIEQEAIDIPSSFPLAAASSTVEFGWVTISEKDFLLPINAQVSLTSKKDNVILVNFINFHKYGKFETDIKILD